jgi:hypothetical protein
MDSSTFNAAKTLPFRRPAQGLLSIQSVVTIGFIDACQAVLKANVASQSRFHSRILLAGNSSAQATIPKIRFSKPANEAATGKPGKRCAASERFAPHF